MTKRIKELAKLINEGLATTEQQIEYYELMISISNNNTEAGQKSISRYNNKLNELKNIVILESDNNKMFSQIYKMGLKKGDTVQINFNDGKETTSVITGIKFGEYWSNTRYTDKQYKMYIEYKKEDGQEYTASTKNMKSIQVLERSKKSKNIILDSNKTLKSVLVYNNLI